MRTVRKGRGRRGIWKMNGGDGKNLTSKCEAGEIKGGDTKGKGKNALFLLKPARRTGEKNPRELGAWELGNPSRGKKSTEKARRKMGKGKKPQSPVLPTLNRLRPRKTERNCPNTTKKREEVGRELTRPSTSNTRRNNRGDSKLHNKAHPEKRKKEKKKGEAPRDMDRERSQKQKEEVTKERSQKVLSNGGGH